MLQTSNLAVLLILFPALFISGIHKVPGLKFNGGWVTWPDPAKGLLGVFTDIKINPYASNKERVAERRKE